MGIADKKYSNVDKKTAEILEEAKLLLEEEGYEASKPREKSIRKNSITKTIQFRKRDQCQPIFSASESSLHLQVLAPLLLIKSRNLLFGYCCM